MIHQWRYLDSVKTHISSCQSSIYPKTTLPLSICSHLVFQLVEAGDPAHTFSRKKAFSSVHLGLGEAVHKKLPGPAENGGSCCPLLRRLAAAGLNWFVTKPVSSCGTWHHAVARLFVCFLFLEDKIYF